MNLIPAAMVFILAVANLDDLPLCNKGDGEWVDVFTGQPASEIQKGENVILQCMKTKGKENGT